MNKDDVAGLVERLGAVGTQDNPVEFYGLAGLAKDALTTLSAENERLESHIKKLEEANKQLRMALGDLLSWFPDKPTKPHWQIEAGEQGADDAITYARELFEKGAAKNDAA